MPQIDGLRAVAISAVVVGHYFPGWGWVAWLHPHWLGVELFFVVSGFLITSILLREREAVAAGGSLGGAMWRFYVRRFLRIFPAYYLVLGLACASGYDPETNRLAGWHFAYLSNVAFAREGTWVGSASHLWTLAVEEQFYLVWPVVVLLTPRRWLMGVLAGVVAVGPVFRTVGMMLGLNWAACFVLTPGSLDCLGIGAMLACVGVGGMRRWVRIGMLGVGLLVLGVAYGVDVRSGPMNAVWMGCWGLGVALVFGWVVWRAATGFGGPVGAVLSAGPVRYIGMISYGIYLLHDFAWMALLKIGFNPVVLRSSRGLVPMLAATLLMAGAMWHLYERPISGLKRWVPYVRGPGRRQGAGLEATKRRYFGGRPCVSFALYGG
jgi:peptidoglycan/LPS O-acetylase OafA/YrhL